jgi:hypothetical protein
MIENARIRGGEESRHESYMCYGECLIDETNNEDGYFKHDFMRGLN